MEEKSSGVHPASSTYLLAKEERLGYISPHTPVTMQYLCFRRSSPPPYLLLLLVLVCGSGNGQRTFLAAQAQTPPPPKISPSPAPSVQPVEIDPETQKPIVTLPDGLKIIDEVVGTGLMPKGGDTVSINYTGKLTNGQVFDSSDRHGGPFTYQHQITQLIRGWTEGVSTMRKGGKRKLIIPPELGYGFEGMGDVIPPNATLIFEIELVDVKPLAP